jgi:hypothetical protein
MSPGTAAAHVAAAQQRAYKNAFTMPEDASPFTKKKRQREATFADTLCEEKEFDTASVHLQAISRLDGALPSQPLSQDMLDALIHMEKKKAYVKMNKENTVDLLDN